MAKTKWTDSNDILTVTLPKSGLTADFDMKLLCDGYDTLKHVVQTALRYGVKQKLADCIARGADVKLSDAEAVNEMINRYDDICAGNWNKVGITRAANPINAMKELATPEELKVIEAIEAKALAKIKADRDAKKAEEKAKEDKINLSN